MKFSTAPIGTRVVMVEHMDLEVRWTHYERRVGVSLFNPNPKKPTNYLPAYRLRTVQGIPGEKPRYDSGEYYVETELDGRIEVIHVSEIPELAITPIRQSARLPLLLQTLKSDHPAIIEALDRLYLLARISGITVSHEFTIGCEFVCGEHRWRCTDIGSRLIAAICLNKDDDPSWYNGPPYAVAESYFDEDDMKGCVIVSKPA